MAGLYIHIPFCRSKCLYCDFYSDTRAELVESFLSALLREMEFRRRPPFSEATFTTLYLGGGTPSLLSPEQTGRIIDAAFRCFRFGREVEISMEANPGTLSRSRAQGYRRCGVNRLTIGVQSFNDRELRMLSRIHTADEAITAVETARRAGFDNIGIDLIFGIPGQSRGSWESTLERALSPRPEHLSVYGLTYEQGTPMERMKREGRIKPCSERMESRFFLIAAEKLTAAGYEHYEISNYALPGKRSRHNSLYWSGAPYLGLGPSAHSYDGRCRWWNVRSIDEYLKREGELFTLSSEMLTPQQRAHERLMLGLRCNSGIDLCEWRQAFGYDLLPAAERIAARTGGMARVPPFAPHRLLLTLHQNRLGLTRRGLLVYDTLCSAFFSVL